jgi:hypothetical protein
MPLAIVAVHQLRYYLVYGGGASHELSAQGHAYLTSLTPWIVGLAGLALGAFLVRLARTITGAHDTVNYRPRGTGRLWLTAAGGLLAIYIGQELLEGVFATGHAPGLAGVFGGGGWWAVPSAAAVGGLLALLFRGAQVVLTLVAQRRRRDCPRPSLLRPVRPRAAARLALRPLVFGAAGRAPPAVLTVR